MEHVDGYLPLPPGHIVKQVRLLAILRAFQGVHLEWPWFVEQEGPGGDQGPFGFETDLGKKGVVFDGDQSGLNYLLMWNEHGVVALAFDKLKNFDGQTYESYTPEIYLREPHRCSEGGLPVPAELTDLAIECEGRMGPATGGFWSAGNRSSLRPSKTQAVFEPFSWSPREAATRPVREHEPPDDEDYPWDGWGRWCRRRPELVDLAIHLAEQPWDPPTQLDASMERLLLEAFGREQAEATYDFERALTSAEVLRRAGVAWAPPRELPDYGDVAPWSPPRE